MTPIEWREDRDRSDDLTVLALGRYGSTRAAIELAMIQNIGVIGVGGVGGYFGGKLCQLLERRRDLTVSFVARGEHLRAIQNSGLRLKTEHEGEFMCRPTLVTDEIDRLPSLDLCLICVKEFDLAPMLTRLKSKIGDHSIVLPPLNGVDIYARVRELVADGIVLPACVYVGTHIETPGTVAQKGGACKILLGPDPIRPEWSPEELLSLFEDTPIKAEWTRTVEAEIWKKFIFICSFGLVSAAHGKTLGQILDNEGLRNQVQSVIGEVIRVAEASGVNLPEPTAREALEKGRAFPPEAKTSFQRDFERRERKDERDLFAGSILRMARRLNIAAPEIEGLSAKLNEMKPLVPS